MLTTSPTLLERLKRQDEPAAWERFVLLYAPLLLTWSKRQGFQEADADDLTQNLLIKLIQELPTYEKSPGQKFRGWLFRVCANECNDYRRRRATRLLPDSDGLSDVDAGTASLEFDEADYRRELVRRAMTIVRTDFNANTVAAFTAHVMEGRRAKDVALKLGLTVGAVYTAVNRILVRLRQELDGLLD